MTQDKDTIRRNIHELERAMTEAGFVRRGNSWVCGFHDDKSPSANTYTGEDGIPRVKCHAAGCGFCGDVFDVQARHGGRKVEDVLRELKSETVSHLDKGPTLHPNLESLKRAALFATNARGSIEVEDVHFYTDAARWTPAIKTDDAIALICNMLVLRVKVKSGKTFLMAHARPGGLVLKAPAKPWPLFNQIRLQRAVNVVLVEGEKAVKAITPYLPDGWAATTSPGGSENARNADYTPLDGKALVVVWPDYDEANEKTGKRSGDVYADDAIAMIQALKNPPAIQRINPDNLGLTPAGDDVVEYLAEFGGDTDQQKRDAIACALKLAEPVGGSVELHRQIEDTIAGKRRTVAMPWACTSNLSRAFLPGTLTILCGDPGSGKSFWLMELLRWLHRNGVKVAAFMLEEDKAYHLTRALAQEEEDHNFIDTEWVRQNPSLTREAYARHRAFLDTFAPAIDASADAEISHESLLVWIRRKAEAGCRIIAIDPITAAATSDKPWQDDRVFVMKAKLIAREFGCSIVLVTHPRISKNRKGGLDDLAGGAAFPRFAQTVLWLVRHESPKRFKVRTHYGNFIAAVNRSLRLGKTRNGAGAGLEIAFQFNPTSLCFTEHGPVIKDEPDADEPEQVTDPFQTQAD